VDRNEPEPTGKLIFSWLHILIEWVGRRTHVAMGLEPLQPHNYVRHLPLPAVYRIVSSHLSPLGRNPFDELNKILSYTVLNVHKTHSNIFPALVSNTLTNGILKFF